MASSGKQKATKIKKSKAVEDIDHTCADDESDTSVTTLIISDSPSPSPPSTKRLRAETFLIDGAAWEKKTRNNPFRGLEDDDEEVPRANHHLPR